jgi:PilZ domain
MVDNMEHRWSIRKSIQGSVTLTLPPWDKLQADICDISLGGLAITCPYRAIPVNTVATLSFTLERDGRVSHHRLPAQVAHCGNTRIGFLFTEPGRETLHALRDMLYQPATKLSASIAGRFCAA